MTDCLAIEVYELSYLHHVKSPAVISGRSPPRDSRKVPTDHLSLVVSIATPINSNNQSALQEVLATVHIPNMHLPKRCNYLEPMCAPAADALPQTHMMHQLAVKHQS